MRSSQFPRLIALGVSIAAVVVAVSTSTTRAKDEAKPATSTIEAAKTAAVTPPAEVGKKAPNFTLVDTEGKKHSLADYHGKTVVLEWFNPDCPFVKKHHQLHHSMHETQAAAKEMGVVWLAINSGGPGKQGAGLERNVQARSDYELEYPVLLDEDGKVGKMYGALTTPHMFLISAEGNLLYQGAIDDNKSSTELGQLNYVITSLQAVQAGKPIGTANTKSYGCSVKYAS